MIQQEPYDVDDVGNVQVITGSFPIENAYSPLHAKWTKYEL